MSADEDQLVQEILEEIPKRKDAFIQKFLSGREALIAEEKKQRSDTSFRRALSSTAIEADKVVARIRKEERRTIWTSEYEDTLSHQEGLEPFPGMVFSLARDRMEKTKLWKIVRRLPKGALLHSHFDAMIDHDWLFEQALTVDGIHLESPTPLATSAQRNQSPIQFRYAKQEETSSQSAATIWTSEYRPNGLVTAKAAADSFPDGARSGFLKWIKERASIQESESYHHHKGIDAIWARFQSVFPVIRSVLFYEPILRKAIRHMLSVVHKDDVRWIDFRLAFSGPFRKTGCSEPEEGYVELIRIFGEEIEKFKASEAGQGFWGARMIWTTIRKFNTELIIKDMLYCLDAKLAHPHLIAGYDLVGQEDGGRPLKDLLPELFWFRKQCAEEGVEMPFFFHAGECLGDGDETDQNLYDAVLLGTRRIGHGFSLFKHPLLIDMIKERRILIESCPISNEVLRLTHSILSHPLPALLSRGVPIALSNDDPHILGYGATGSSHDFWQALQGWDNLGLAGLGSLAENSVRWAAFEDQNDAEWHRDVKDASMGSGLRAQRMKEWYVEWERFCSWVVDEFGDPADQKQAGDNDSR